MQLLDVNVLVYAHRSDADRHEEYATWLRALVDGDEVFGMSELVLSAFVRVVTNPRVYREPTPVPLALAFASALRNHPRCIPTAPGPRHWPLFVRLTTAASATGNLVTDAYFAALALEHGCEWISTDRDYDRFPGLRWRRPFSG